MTIKKRLTPALSTSLFLLMSIACHVVTIKLFKLFTGEPVVQENAYILTKIMVVYLVIISLAFSIFTRFKLHWECFRPSKEMLAKDMKISSILTVGAIILMVIIRLVMNRISPEVAARPAFGLYLWEHTRWFYPFSAVLQEFFVKGITEDNITASSDKYNRHFSVWMTALFFFVLHMGYDLPMMIGAAAMCVITGYVYEKTRSIWGSSLLHFVVGFVPKMIGII